MKKTHYQFSVPLIDVTRNATDDFNLFHDKFNWNRINNNPFGGAIVLGFQLLGLVAEQLKEHRLSNNETELIKNNHLKYSYYQIKFAQIVKPADTVSVEIKKTLQKSSPKLILSNRFSLKTENTLALIGFNKVTSRPLILENPDFSGFDQNRITNLPDRSFTQNNEWFIKHKYFMNSNAKNFLVGCQVEQASYFDEINDKVEFPEVFPLALSSCALLERANKLGHDFEKEPMVYVSQEHNIDKALLKTLRSNNKMTMIVRKEMDDKNQRLEKFHCYGLLSENQILFRSILTLAPLSTILDSNK